MKLSHNSASALSLAAAVCAISGTSLAAGNVDSATQQIQRVNLKQKFQEPAAEAVPSLYPAEKSDAGVQYVVKPTKPTSNQGWFEAAFDVQYGSTNNALLAESATRETTLMVSTAQIALTPPPIALGDGKLALKTGYRHQKFNYGVWSGNERNYNDLDFDVSTVFAQGRYLFNENWTASAGVDYNRLLTAARPLPNAIPSDPGMYTEFYTELVPSIGLERRFKLTEKSMFTASIGGNWHVSHVDNPNTDRNDRIDEVLMASYLRELAPNLFIQPFYRAAYTQYTRVHSRRDLVQTVGVAVGYSINKWASVRAFVNYEGRDSTDITITDYQKLDTGVGASLMVRF